MSRYPPRRISLLVRNLPLDGRPEELRSMFERYGEVRDVYLPRDYYTDRPRGFGFVEFLDGRDAEEAMNYLDGVNFGGREISVVMSKESRKTPSEMYNKDRYSGAGGRRRMRSPGRRRSYSRSASPYRHRHRSRSRSGGGGGGAGGGGGGGGGGGYSRRYERRSRSPARNHRRYYRNSVSPSRRVKREEPSPASERRYRPREEERRRRPSSKSPAEERPHRRTPDSKSAHSDDKESGYSSSPRSRSRTPDEKGAAAGDVDIKNAGDERPEMGKDESMSPGSDRRDGDDSFRQMAVKKEDYE